MKRLVSMILVLLMLCVPVLSMAETDVNAELAAAASALIELGKTEEAQEILDRMGKGNTASACISLGMSYYEGAFSDGTPDYAGAKQWWQTARELGSDSGTYNLALLCWKGFQDESNVPDYEQAFTLFMEIVDSEDEATSGKALTQLGIGYFKGYFTEDGEPDYVKAHDYLLKGFEKGRSLAASWLGDIAVGGLVTGEPDYEAAYQYYLFAAEDGMSYAAHEIADGYLDGNFNGGVIDVEKALEWYIKADELGSTCAYRHIRDIYEDGVKDADGNFIYEPNQEAEIAYLATLWERGTTDRGVIDQYMYRLYYHVKDYDLAIVVGEKGAEMGSSYCMMRLGDLYKNNLPDPEKSLYWYTQAFADGAGNAFAMINIGDGYKNGFYNNGVPEGEMAAEMYKKADAAGQEDAPARLAQLYCSGIQGEDGAMIFNKDYAAALPYLERLVEAGTDDTYYYEYLGWIYAGNSDACEADYLRALQVYEAGTELGSGYCMWQIGLIYLNGDLGEADAEKAVDWLNRAVENGEERAQEDLDTANAMLEGQ